MTVQPPSVIAGNGPEQNGAPKYDGNSEPAPEAAPVVAPVPGPAPVPVVDPPTAPA